MILRFCSGSSTPASAREEAPAGVDAHDLHAQRRQRGHDLVALALRRSRPWSTNRQVSRSPMARASSAATTLESTPPESPQTTCDERPPGGARRRSARRGSPRSSSRASASRPGTGSGAAGRFPTGVWTTSGWNCRKCHGPRQVAGAGEGAVGGVPDRDEALRQRGDLVAVAHPGLGTSGQAGDERVGPVDVVGLAGRTPRCAALRSVAPSFVQHHLHAVADAQQRHRGSSARGSKWYASAASALCGRAREDDRPARPVGQRSRAVAGRTGSTSL